MAVNLEGNKGKYSFDPFSEESIIGEGGMGIVYLGTELGSNTKVAIKVLFKELSSNPVNIERALKESSIKVDHKNLIRMIEFVEKDGIYHIISEYLSGQSLDKYIEQNKSISQDKSIFIINEVLSGLSFLHNSKPPIIHRDIKPSNIFLCDNGNVKIMDFGVARSLQNGNKRLTKTGSVVGTPYYAAPEQIRSQSNLINPRTDIYSLGVTLYELLSGTIPFEGKSEYDTLKMQVEEPLPPHPKISSKLFQIISKATAKDQKKRFKDAKAFQKELVPFLKISAKSTSNRNDVKNKRSSMSRVLNFIFIPLSIAFGVLFFITKGELDDLRWSYDYNQYTLSDNVTKLREQLDRSNKAFPFEIESIRIRALDYYDDNTVVYGYEDHLRGGQNLKLQSRISYRYYGDESVSAEIYYKIYDPNEKLVVGSAWDQNPVSTNVRYSYKNTMELLPSNQLETFTFGWFRSYWESGYYRIEFWYHDKCLGSKTFVLN